MKQQDWFQRENRRLGIAILAFFGLVTVLGDRAMIAVALCERSIYGRGLMVCLALAMVPALVTVLVATSRTRWLRWLRKHVILVVVSSLVAVVYAMVRLLLAGKVDLTQAYTCVNLAGLAMMAAVGAMMIWGMPIDEKGYAVTDEVSVVDCECVVIAGRLTDGSEHTRAND